MNSNFILRPLKLESPQKFKNMQLKFTNLASVSRNIERYRGNSAAEDLETPVCPNRIKDIGQMIVMSGTAKRKAPGKCSTSQPLSIAKNEYRESLLKLRTPYYKTRQKQNQTEEKLLNKSCEILFQHLKPYKDIQMIKGNNAHKREWNSTTESILKTTNVVYQKTATRKVEILSIFEETPTYNFHKETSIFDYLTNEGSFLFEYNHFHPEDNYKNLEPSKNSQVKEGFNTLQKAVSSEDFITNAFPEP